MAKRTEIGLFFVAVYFNIYSASFITCTGNEICGRTIHLGRQTFAVRINYFTFTHIACWASIKLNEPYSAVLRLKSIEGRCDSHLTIYDQPSFKYVSFCDYHIPTDHLIDSSSQITLQVNHSLIQPYKDQFTMIIYAYRTYEQSCDSPWYRCMNGRCIHRDLYCDTDFSYCSDGRIKNCYNDITESSSPSSFGNIVGVLALVITLFLVIIVVLYFCCCRVRRRFNQNNRNDNRQRTARDVYVIPTSHDNPDGVDYVIDYLKFTEPPAYETLEMTVLSGPSRHAFTDNPHSPSNHSASNMAINHGFVSDGEYDDNQTEDTAIGNEGYQVSGSEGSVQVEAGVDPSQDTIDSSTVNDASDSTADELPTYTDVLSNRAKFRVV